MPERVQTLCADIERSARAHDLDGLQPLVDRLDVEYDVLVRHLNALHAAADVGVAETALT
jgi:hypothetical protein